MGNALSGCCRGATGGGSRFKNALILLVVHFLSVESAVLLPTFLFLICRFTSCVHFPIIVT